MEFKNKQNACRMTEVRIVMTSEVLFGNGQKAVFWGLKMISYWAVHFMIFMPQWRKIFKYILNEQMNKKKVSNDNKKKTWLQQGIKGNYLNT